MEKRWNVYHGNDYLGLKTAKEIREALRQGTLDPFDKVSREGSNIREDLIEVDEIFREAPPEPAALENIADTPATEGTVVADRSALIAAAASVGKSAGTGSKNKPKPVDDSQDSENSEDFHQRNDTGTRNSAKRYYLIDREKVLGPLSALEIQSLFNRNMLNKKVRVQKIGNEKTIPITQFIASYSGDRLKELAEDGRIPQQIGVGSPSSKVMNELARMANSRRVAQDRKNRAYLVMSFVGLILGALVYLIYEQSTREPEPQDAVEERSEEPSPANKPRPRLIQKTPEPAPKKESPPPPPPVKKAEKEKERAKPAPRRVERRPTRKAAPVTRVSQRRDDDEPRKTDNIPQQRGPGPIAKAMESAGRIQTIGPLTFSSAALESCPSKCTLTLFDGTGASMKAVFFKNAYNDQLRSRARGAYLTGNTKMDRGELTLFIQDVR
jgi:type IV secretory pathway VirB10-like protein